MAARTDREVQAFYVSGGGERMFDPARWTREVEAYVTGELAPLVRAGLELDHLVEVGCGPGLHLDWALEAGWHYDGIDLVEPLLAQGRARVAGLAPSPRRRGFSRASGDALDDWWSAQGLAADLVCVAFPFNCLGTVARPGAALAAAARTGAHIYVSVFATSAHATMCRLAYYARCGYSALQVARMAHGVLITSRDGLHSLAPEERVVSGWLQGTGYSLAARDPLASLGLGLLFAPPGADVR